MYSLLDGHFIHVSHHSLTHYVFHSHILPLSITDEGVVADVEAYCCPTASSSKQRGACSVKNEMRQDCCWQRPCYNPSVSSRISGNGEFIVLSTDMAPGDTTQINYDWEIVHYHIPSGKTTQITNTDDKNHDEFFPSISRKGDVVGECSS